MGDTPAAVAIRGLSKSFRVGHLRGRMRPALVDLTLDVPRGAVFGYLGPNGSGKTTTLKLLMGMVSPDAGTATILGHALTDRAWRQRAGYVPENPYLYDYLTAREYLDYVGRLFGLPSERRRERAHELLALVGLSRSADAPLRRYSKGMLQRVGLAQALVNEPELVFMDEPMSGLDALGRRMARDIIVDLKRKGCTVFFSTHILSDAEALCDSVALLRGGRLLRVGRLDEILQIDVTHLEVLASGVDEPTLRRIGLAEGAKHAMGERWRLEIASGGLGGAVQELEKAGGRILSVSPVRQSLEDYFFQEMTPEERESGTLEE
jgi:ABC-2 type transport system ATP-binding protein